MAKDKEAKADALATITTEAAAGPITLATQGLLSLAEDMEITDEQAAIINATAASELFVQPYKMTPKDGGMAKMFLVYLGKEPFTLASVDAKGNPVVVNMVRARLYSNSRRVIRFLESTGMRGQFIEERKNCAFYMEHTGEVKTSKPMPCKTYIFGWLPPDHKIPA